MVEIHKYVIVDANDTSQDYQYDTLAEAKEAAANYEDPVAIIERLFTFEDSELVWTSTGDTVWPPQPQMTIESVGAIRDGKTVWSATRPEEDKP